MPAPAIGASISFKTIAQLKGIQELIEGIKTVIETTAQFESQMSRVSAVAQVAGDDLLKLSAKARELGAETVFTATEAGKGMEELARLGFDVDKIYSAVQSTLNLAASSALDLGRASEITAGSINAFRLEASEAERIVDVLAITAARTGANVSSIGEAVGKAGAIASTAGISFEEFAGFIGVLGDRLIRGSEAGTNFRQFLRGLLVENKNNSAALKELGLDFSDVDVTVRGLTPVLETLRDAFGRLGSKQERISIAAQIWGQRQFNAGLIAIQSVDKLNELTEAYDKGGGSAERMAEIMTDNLAGSFKFFKSAMQEVALTIGDELLPEMTELIDQLTESARAFASAEGSAKTVGKVLASVVDGVIILLNSLGAVPDSVRIVFGSIITQAQKFEIEFLERFASIAESLGRDEFAASLRNRALEIREAFDQNIKVIDDAREGLQDNLLNISDAFDRSVDRWKDSTDKIKDIKIDLGPLEDSLKSSLGSIREVIASEGRDLDAEVQALRDVLNFSRLFEGIDTEALTEDQIEGLKARVGLLIGLFENAGLEIDQRVLEFRKSLDNIGKSVSDSSEEVDRGALGLEGALSKVGTIITSSGEVIKVGANKIKKALADIIGFDRDKILENAAAIEAALSQISKANITLDLEQKESLSKQIQEIVNDFVKLKENVPPLIREAAQSFGIYVETFQQVGESSRQMSDDVEGSSKSIGESVGAISQSINRMGGDFTLAGNRTEEGMRRSTKVVKEFDEQTAETATKIVADNALMSESANKVGVAYDETSGKTDKFRESQDKVATSTSKGRTEIEGVSTAAASASENLDKAAMATGQMATAGENLEGSLAGGVESLKSFKTLGSEIKEVFESLTGITIAPKIDSSELISYIEMLREALRLTEELEAKAG